jgi:hypothetical protein
MTTTSLADCKDVVFAGLVYLARIVGFLVSSATRMQT